MLHAFTSMFRPVTDFHRWISAAKTAQGQATIIIVSWVFFIGNIHIIAFLLAFAVTLNVISTYKSSAATGNAWQFNLCRLLLSTVSILNSLRKALCGLPVTYVVSAMQSWPILACWGHFVFVPNHQIKVTWLDRWNGRSHWFIHNPTRRNTHIKHNKVSCFIVHNNIFNKLFQPL